MNNQLSQTEKRILQNIHLTGTMGKCGSLTKKQRLSILNKLIENKLLTDRLALTPKGIEVSAPSY